MVRIRNGPKAPLFRAEDQCIVTGDTREEVIGCSEWMRCADADMEFMAAARWDVPFLLNLLDNKPLIDDSRLTEIETRDALATPYHCYSCAEEFADFASGTLSELVAEVRNLR